MNSEGTLVVLIADLHINSTTAICPPIVPLDDGGEYRASRTQRWLYDCFSHFWKYVAEKANGRRVIGIINGDLAELDCKRRSNQLISPNKATIQSVVIETLAPAMDVVTSWVFIRGTPAHSGKSAWIEEFIANDTDTSIWYSPSIASFWHFQGKIENVRLDICHHASIGGRPYNRSTSAIRLASDTIWWYRVGMDQLAPNIIARSHGHVFADSGENFKDTRAFYTPCWIMGGEYTFRIGRENDVPSIGGLLYDCHNGKYEWEKMLYEPKETKRVWKLNL